MKSKSDLSRVVRPDLFGFNFPRPRRTTRATNESMGTEKIAPSIALRYYTIVSLSLLSSAVSLLLMSGCGDVHAGTSSPAPIVTVTANPTSIAAGSSATVTVTATNATQVTVAGSDGSSYTLQPAGGTQTVTPTATTTYTATASGAGGQATATAVVTVAGSSSPKPTVTIGASPSAITSGNSSTLTVAATNATQVVVTGTDGSSYTLPAAGGTQAVSPTATTTYTATATGAGGTSTATAVVAVALSVGAPTVTVSASPTSVNAGTSSVLTVAATNAAQVVVTGSDGTSYTLQAAGGTQAVSPTATTTYTATATGAGGTATATAVVTVGISTAAPTVTISANPTSLNAGASSTLSVAATNATQVVVKGSDGSSYTLQPTGGSSVVSPSVTTTYTVTATGPGGTATANAVVTVTSANPSPTVTISAGPASIASGASTTLTVTATNATAVVVTGSDGSSYQLQPAGGSQLVTPSATTTYTATATGTGGKVSATAVVTITVPAATVTISANPVSVNAGGSSVLTVAATHATQVVVTGSDGTSNTLQPSGGTLSVTPTATTTYTATATSAGGNATATATVTVGSVQAVQHVIFLLQENHSFDNYFGMLNPYRHTNQMNVGDDGVDYEVDGIDDKLTKIANDDDENTSYPLFKMKSTCVDDESSAWLESYGDVNRYDFSKSRSINMDGFVHNAEGFAKSCNQSKKCSGAFTDTNGQRAMGYYDEDFLNYYYYMASQFAVSDRWFSPISSKSVDNRIATFTGGTTGGLVKDPGGDDHVGQLPLNNIFEELDKANVTWKVYYWVTQGFCLNDDECGSGLARYPATDFNNLSYSYKYLYENTSGAACTPPTQPSSVVGDTTNSFCIDPTHIAPISTYQSDLTNDTLPSFAFIEAGYAHYDEHPGSGQSILEGQEQVAGVINAFMASKAWNNSVFFFSYDEGGGPYDHVPPVPGHSNDKTDASLAAITPKIDSIAVNPDSNGPCVPSGAPTTHCDLDSSDPGANSGDAAAVHGFAAQLGFRLPNIVISPFTRRHYVSHIPMDHTAVIKFVENRFIGSSAHLTARDAAQPDLMDFFDFGGAPWSTPPTPPAPVTAATLGYDPCTPADLAP